MKKGRTLPSYLLILSLAPFSLISVVMYAPAAFAMGQNGCINEYDGPFVSFIINNGSQTFDALANPGLTFNSHGSFNVTFVIHTPSVNSWNNTNTGSAWYGEDVYGYEDGHCVGSVGPSQNVTVSQTVSNQRPYGGYVQSILFSTRASSSATFNVQWQSSPSIPQNVQATSGNSQVSLSWSAPVDNGGYPVTNYKIYRSTTSGNETLLTEIGSVMSYTDTAVNNGQTYFYKVTAVNSIGESTPSNEANATPTAPSTTGSSTTSGIILNNAESTSGTTDSSNQMTLSSFNSGTGADQLLVVGVSANNNNAVSVTFNGMPLTQEVSSFTNNDAEFWYLKDSSGTGNIVVTMAGPTQAVVGAYSFANVNQTNPIAAHVAKHNTSASSPSISIAAKYANDMVLDLPSIYGGVTLSSPTCTNEWDANVPNAITGASSSQAVSTPGTVTCGWVASSPDMWDDVAIDVQADSTSSGTTSGSGSTSGSSGGSSSGSITLGNVQSVSGTASSSNQMTISNFNAGTATNQLLLVGISANNNNVASVTFNGMPLTHAVSSFTNNDAEFWYLANPTGTGNVVVTFSGATQAVVGAYSFSGVNQTAPIAAKSTGHNTSASSPAISIAAKYANDTILDLPSIYGGSTLGSPTCAQEWDDNVPSAVTGASSLATVSSPASVTCKWTASSADMWDDVAVELRAN